MILAAFVGDGLGDIADTDLNDGLEQLECSMLLSEALFGAPET